MSYNLWLFSDIENRFKVWFKNSDTGDVVVNPAKDYLNRAQDILQMKYPWEGLWKDSTISLTGSTATFPSDFVRLIGLGSDYDNDGKFDYRYWRYGRKVNGFKVRKTFAKATGSTWTITFFNTPSNTVILRYQARLEDFEDNDTGYSFFPADLLLKQAQLLRMEESGEVQSSEYTRAERAFKALFKDYIQSEQDNGYELRIETVLENGEILELPTIDLTGTGNNLERAYVLESNSQDA